MGLHGPRCWQKDETIVGAVRSGTPPDSELANRASPEVRPRQTRLPIGARWRSGPWRSPPGKQLLREPRTEPVQARLYTSNRDRAPARTSAKSRWTYSLSTQG